ncbi:MAG TPA: TIGR03435 family protein [Bryobacteraceae bacterium]|jgi:uncharacterized protein (TIGR03435 family)|nr:TIGR03435 family protein [Bryobacteraceae bacterium]
MKFPGLLLAIAFACFTQERPGAPAFEAASLKAVAPGRTGLPQLHGGPGTGSPGQLSGAATLKALVMRAYGVKEYQVSGPGWMDTQRYEIAAKVPAGATGQQVAAMLRTLLAARLRMEVRLETRELPIYSLVVAKNGPKLAKSAGDSAASGDPAPRLVAGADGLPDLPPGAHVPRSYEVVVAGPDGILYKLWARRESMEQLADRLNAVVNRAVVDRTGLAGLYDFTLAWSLESAGGMIPRNGPPPDAIESRAAPVLSDPGLSMFNALPSQLGLRLEPGKGRVEMVVVTRADRLPAEN